MTLFTVSNKFKNNDYQENDTDEVINGSTLNHPIIYIKNMLNNSLPLQGLLGIFIMILATAASALFTGWPQHNVICNPEYWYELLGPAIFGYMTISAGVSLVDCWTVMKIEALMSMKAYWILFIVTSAGFVIPYVMVHAIWVHIVEFNHPMPFHGSLCLLFSQIAKCMGLWFLVPSNLRVMDKLFRKRLWWYMVVFPVGFIIGQCYSQLLLLFRVVPLKMQWCIGFLLPVMKKLNTWILTKVASKAAGSKTISAKMAKICHLGSLHSFSVAVVLGSNVSSLTTYVVFAVDSIPNVWSCIRIWKLFRQSSPTAKAEMNELVSCLTLRELFEISVPAVYCASFIIAYYGPNANILGNVQNDMWHYSKVTNVYDKLNNIVIFFVADLCRGVCLAMVLWKFCRINIWRTYCNIVYEYGLLMFLFMTGCHNVVRKLSSLRSNLIRFNKEAGTLCKT